MRARLQPWAAVFAFAIRALEWLNRHNSSKSIGRQKLERHERRRGEDQDSEARPRADTSLRRRWRNATTLPPVKMGAARSPLIPQFDDAALRRIGQAARLRAAGKVRGG